MHVSRLFVSGAPEAAYHLLLQMSLLGFRIRSVRIGGRHDVEAARRILADLAAEGEERVDVEIEIEPKILTDIDVLLGAAFRACTVSQ